MASISYLIVAQLPDFASQSVVPREPHPLAFAWCLIAGHWHYGEAKELPLNKHMRPAKGLFRLGIDMLCRVLKNEGSKNDQIGFHTLLQVLSRT